MDVLRTLLNPVGLPPLSMDALQKGGPLQTVVLPIELLQLRAGQ